MLNYTYAGDPLKLESFITVAELVETFASNADTKAICVKFIKAKLESKALECLPDQIETVKDITDALRNANQPESSKVVEGKMLALRVNKGDFTKFNEQAEKLAEAFRRSLINEGMTKAKSQELTISKTVELCRKTARSEIVKSILSSGTYTQPSEVLAKLITENEVVKREETEKNAFL